MRGVWAPELPMVLWADSFGIVSKGEMLREERLLMNSSISFTNEEMNVIKQSLVIKENQLCSLLDEMASDSKNLESKLQYMKECRRQLDVINTILNKIKK